MAEVKNLLLTAGHDLDSLRQPVTLDIASGEESYILMRGQPGRVPQATKAGDMQISDREGILSTIIYGPDQRTQIRETTRNRCCLPCTPRPASRRRLSRPTWMISSVTSPVGSAGQVEVIEIFGSRCWHAG